MFCDCLLTKENVHSTVIAHNQAGYDGKFILAYCLKAFLVPSKYIQQSNRISYLYFTKFHLRFIDSLSFFLCPLAKLSETFEIDSVKGHFLHKFNIADNQHFILNMPPENEYYDPQRTIVFQMEPWVNDNSKKWGVKTWGKWANPNPSEDLFLKVFGRKTNDYNNVFWQLELNYNQLVDLKYDIKDKRDEISSICSSKYFDEGHIHRIDFLKFIEQKIENQYSIKLNIFNSDNKFNFKNYRGVVSPYVDKSKGILPYKYYFMVENNYEDDFITEKIWEPILCESLCFYYGCPNIDNYVDMDAFVLLDMNDFEKSYAIIKKAIEEDWWSKRIESIRAQKDKFLKKMGFFPRLESFINTL